MGRREGRQTPMWLAGPELARSPGHRFYEKLNELLSEAGFDRRVEALCAPYFEADDKPHAGARGELDTGDLSAKSP